MKIRAPFFTLVVLQMLVAGVQAQWAYFRGPLASGAVTTLVSNDSSIFIGCNGVAHSEDTGKTWTFGTGSLTGAPQQLVIQKNVLAAAAGEVHVSVDGGMRWTRHTAGLPSGIPVYAIALQDSTILAGTYSAGVYRSTDLGTSFSVSDSGITNNSIRSMTYLGTLAFAGTGGGVFRSDDDGKTWSSANNGILTPYISVLVVYDSLLLAGTYGGGIYRSLDSGKTWIRTLDKISNDNVSGIACTGDLFLASTSKQVLRSTDAYNWDVVTGPYSPTAITGHWGMVFVGTSEGVFRSPQLDAAWQVCGIARGTVSLLSKQNGIFYAGTHTGVFRSTDHGDHWNAIGIGPTSFTADQLIPGDTSVLLCGTNSPLRWSTTMDVWSSSDTLLRGLTVNTGVRMGDRIIIGTSNRGVWYSKDDGQSWQQSDSIADNQYVVSLTSIGGELFAAVSGQPIQHSTDSGATWTRSGAASPISFNDKLATNGSLLYDCGGYDHILVSEDRGQTWTQYLVQTSFSAAHIATDRNYVFLSNYNGNIFASKDFGHTWQQRFWIPNLQDMMADSGYLYVASPNGIAYIPEDSLSVSPLTMGSNSPTVVIYPNPTRENICATGLPDDATTIAVCDLLGRTVRTVVPDASHSTSFSCIGMTPGTYVMRIVTPSGVIARLFVIAAR
ncbi:MAG: T9SS type A sorting domain-containing protein [Bacteroidetes bacterium]|nr:T9SS type A sorting domain-containing protein [Bacteroidota bacterium]